MHGPVKFGKIVQNDGHTRAFSLTNLSVCWLGLPDGLDYLLTAKSNIKFSIRFFLQFFAHTQSSALQMT